MIDAWCRMQTYRLCAARCDCKHLSLSTPAFLSSMMLTPCWLAGRLIISLTISHLVGHVIAPICYLLKRAVSVHTVVEFETFLVWELYQAELLPAWILDECDESVLMWHCALIVIWEETVLVILVNDFLHNARLSVVKYHIAIPIVFFVSSTDCDLLWVYRDGNGGVSRAQSCVIDLDDNPFFVLQEACIFVRIFQTLDSIKTDLFTAACLVVTKTTDGIDRGALDTCR